MKKIIAILLAVMSFSVFANTWTDPSTGITWTYTVSNSEASVGGGSYSSPAVPKSTTGAITIPSTLGSYPITSIGDYAFYNCSSLTSVTIPSSVTSISGEAFYGCSSLTAVTIPSSVTSIGGRAFSGCSSLTSITIPSSVTSIGNQAFYGTPFYNNQPIGMVILGGGVLYRYKGSCPAIVVIPSSVTSISGEAFSGCRWLTSITIPEGVTSIGDSAFYNCNSLTSITIPSSVTSIGDYAFYNCNSLTSVTIPSSVTSIGSYAFYGCRSLTSVTIPSSVTSIGSSAFYNCNSLTSVTIPSSVTSIGSYAFYGCSSLTSVTIPSSVTSIGSYAFYGCRSLTSVTIPSSVTSIGNSAFYNCSSLTSVTILEGVTSIGSSAFDGCSSLTSITIPSSVTSIGYRAFYGCSSLTSVTIPSSVTSIGDAAFRGCSSLTSITIPEGVTSIGDYAFRDCSSLTSVTIPEGVTSIGREAFAGCSSLTLVTIPEGLTSIGYAAFCNCSSLTSITVPSSVTSIGDSAFDGCSSLTSVTIPEGVTSIGHSAFSGCSGLTFVTIPSSVTSIGYCAFYNCSSLTSVTIPSSVTSIGSSAFYGCRSLASVTIPSSVTSIDNDVFSGCISLTSVMIPSSVTSIGEWAFDGCISLTSVTIPSSVTSIGSYAFEDCTSLTSITIPEGVMSIGEGAFSGTAMITNHSDGMVIVDGCLISYKGMCPAKVVVPEGVRLIADYAFSGCSSLTSVTIPSSVTSIGYGAINGCSGLVSVILPFVGSKKANSEIESSLFGYIFGSYSYPGSMVVCHYGPSSSLISRTYYIPISLKTVIITNGDAQIGSCAFSGCSGLTSITIPEGVTSIGDSAFFDCSSLASVTIPEGVTSIGDYAFRDCSSLTSVTIPEGVTSIGRQAFYNCSSLASVTIPLSVTSIGEEAFCGCSSLTSVTIPEGVTSIGGRAFSGCSSLTSVKIPEGVTSIGEEAFYGCRGLKSVTIPSSLISIGSSAFSGCNKIKAVTMPLCAAKISDTFPDAFGTIMDVKLVEGGTEVGDGVFANCGRITSVVIPSSVTSIGDGAFCGCAGLTAITIPLGVTNIADGAFDGCDSLKVVFVEGEPQDCVKEYFGNRVWYQDVGSPINYEWEYDIEGDNAIITGIKPDFGDAIIPTSCEGFPVTGIGDSAFSDCSGLSSVTIPSSVTSIGYDAFRGCMNLTVKLECACPNGYEQSGITSVRAVEISDEYSETYPHAQDKFPYSYVMSSCALIIDGVGGKTYTQFIGEMEPSSSLSEYSRLAIGCNDEVRFLEPDEYSITEHYGWKYIVARVEGEYADRWHLVIGNPAFRGYAGGANDEWFYQYWNRGTLASRYDSRRGDVVAITPQDGDWPWIDYSEFGQMGEYADFLDGVYYLYLPRIEADSGNYPEYKYGQYSGLKVTINSSTVFYAGPEYEVYNVDFDLGFQGGNVTIHARQPDEVQDPWYSEWVDIKPYYDEYWYDEYWSGENEYPYYTLHGPGWAVADGWQFVGWKDEEGRQYANLEEYWSWYGYDSLRFTAQYELIQYELEYVDEKGDYVSNPNEFNVQNPINLVMPKDVSGWTCLGWFDETDALITNTSQLTAQKHVLTAKWARVYNEVLFEAEGCGGFDDDELVAQDVAWGDRACVPGVVPDLGWRFLEWSDDVLQPIYSNSVFVARFEMVTNKISYLNTKSAQNTNVQNYVVSDKITFIALSDLPDWHFDGWSPASIPMGSIGDVEVRALWRPIETAEIVGEWSQPQMFEYDGEEHGVDYSARLDVMDWPLNVTKQGTVRAINVGEYAVTAIAKTVGVPETETVYYRCAAVTNECKWTITPKPVGKLVCTVVSAAMVADGTPKTPMVVVYDAERNVRLGAEDYTLVYENNVNAGFGIARIVGRGNYGSETTISFEILETITVDNALNQRDSAIFEFAQDTDWVADNIVTHDGYASMRSGAIGDNETSTLEAIVHGAGTISFQWKVSSQSFDMLELDRLEFYVDGKRRAWINGERNWDKVSFKVDGAGPHTLSWVYAKDDALAEGEDCGWIDEVVWDKEWLIGDWLNDVDRTFVVNGDNGGLPWGADAEQSADGVGSMRSGLCPQNGVSVLSTVVRNSGNVSFKWKSSCIEYGDYRLDSLSFVVDGDEVAWINGETDWREVAYRVSGVGNHTLQWIFRKVGETSYGDNCGWVDEFTWNNEPLVFSEDDIEVTAYEGIYDGKAHGIEVSVPNLAEAVIRYGASEDAITEAESPKFSDCGEHEVWFSINAEDFKEYVGLAKVSIVEKSIVGAMVVLGDALTYNGDVLAQSVASVSVDGLEVPIFEVRNNEAISAGEHTLTVVGGGNFTGEVEVTFAIAKAKPILEQVALTGAIEPNANTVAWVYDGNAHSPEILAGYDGNAIVGYSLSEECPFANSVEFVEITDEPAKVWYEIVSDNYETLYGWIYVIVEPCPIDGATVVLGVQKTDVEGRVEQTVESVVSVSGLPITFEVLDNVSAVEGDFELTITGIGNFTGSLKWPYYVGRIVKPPTLTPGDGTVFTDVLTVVFSSTTEGAVHYFTVDGSTPTAQSRTASRVRVTEKTAIKAISVVDGSLWSAVSEATYALGRCRDPIIKLTGVEGEIFHFPNQAVEIEWENANGVLYYTLDGSEPTKDSRIYDGPFVISDNAIVKAKVFSDTYFDSATISANFRKEPLTVSTPVINAESEFTGRKTSVSMTCATDGAEIRYTLDGSEPTANSTLYQAALTINMSIGDTFVIKAKAFCANYIDSATAESTTMRIWGVGDALNAPDLKFANGGDAHWYMVTDVTYDGTEAMRSGVIGDGECSILSTTVNGEGVISFYWRTDCEDSKGYYDWDHLDFVVDDKVMAQCDGWPDWTHVLVQVSGVGVHTLKWIYVKDFYDSDGEDCAWIDEVKWERKTAGGAIIADVTALKEAFGEESSAVRNLTSEEELVKFNEFLGKCGITTASQISEKQKQYAYESFRMSAIMVEPQLFENEPKLKIHEFKQGEGGWSVSISLKAGGEEIAMAKKALEEHILVGNKLTEITATPNIVTRPSEDGSSLTFTIAPPEGRQAFIMVRL